MLGRNGSTGHAAAIFRRESRTDLWADMNRGFGFGFVSRDDSQRWHVGSLRQPSRLKSFASTLIKTRSTTFSCQGGYTLVCDDDRQRSDVGEGGGMTPPLTHTHALRQHICPFHQIFLLFVRGDFLDDCSPLGSDRQRAVTCRQK